MTGDLTTLNNVKDWLNLLVPPITASDATLARLITAASTSIQTLMSRTIAVNTYVEARNGMGGWRMMTINSPIVNVGQVTINGITIPPRPALTGFGNSTPLSGYTFDQQIIYLTGFQYCWGQQNVVLTYDAGFATVPFDIEQACITLVGNWFKWRDRIGKSAEAIEGQTISFSSKMYADGGVMDIINANKRVAPVY